MLLYSEIITREEINYVVIITAFEIRTFQISMNLYAIFTFSFLRLIFQMRISLSKFYMIGPF